MKKQNRVYLGLAVFIGIALGLYVFNYILKESKQTAASRELELWIPAAAETMRIYELLDAENRDRVETMAKAGCSCVHTEWNSFAEPLTENEYASIDPNELRILVLPFFECISNTEDDVAELTVLDERSFNAEVKSIYKSLLKSEQETLFVFLFLIEMNKSCNKEATDIITVIRKIYEGGLME
jgi:hypothetical protein